MACSFLSSVCTCSTYCAYATGTVCKAHHELGRISSSWVRFQHAVHYTLAGKEQQRLFVQLLDEEERWHNCGKAEESFQRCSPAGEDLCKEVPPHPNVGSGVWALQDWGACQLRPPRFADHAVTGLAHDSVTAKCHKTTGDNMCQQWHSRHLLQVGCNTAHNRRHERDGDAQAT